MKLWQKETRRKLLLRDSLTFLSLTLLTIALFTVTLLLFRSFASHRTALGIRWSDRGRVALTDGHPEQAIDSLRTALAYTPGERSYELLLAQALAEAGHTDEAFNYFSGLWETQPGSGFVNLQLARISARKKDPQQAINFYRAAIYGTWEGDGVVRRRDVRLELARYLLSRRDISAARAELLVAEGNADNNSALDMQLGALFEQAGDRTDALETYLKASEAAPGTPKPFAPPEPSPTTWASSPPRNASSSRRAREPGNNPLPDSSEVATLLHNSERILALLPSRKLSARERVDRLLALKTIARKRLDTCTADLPGALPPALQRSERSLARQYQAHHPARTPARCIAAG